MRECNRVDVTDVSIEWPYNDFSGLGIPDSDCPVLRAGNDALIVLRECDRVDERGLRSTMKCARTGQLLFPINNTSMHTMRTIAFSIANVVAGRQPLVSTLATDTRHIRPADKFVDPALDQEENHRMVTIPFAGQAQTPIRRRVKVVHKTNYENVTEQMKEEYGACLNLQR